MSQELGCRESEFNVEINDGYLDPNTKEAVE